jgi:hypothetical protein
MRLPEERLMEFKKQDPAIANLFAALGLESPERKFAFLDEYKAERHMQEVIAYLGPPTDHRCAQVIYPVNPGSLI